MRVSICIPHYEQPESLLRAVQSALAQTQSGHQVEILVCDNASGPPSQDVLRRIEESHWPVRVIRNKYNTGLVANWNRVVGESTGRVICLLSADDELLPNAVESACREFMSDPHLDLVYGPATIVYEKDTYRMPLTGVTEHVSTYSRRLFKAPEFVMWNREVPEIQLASAFFTRRSYDSVGGFKGEVGSQTDWLFWAEIGSVGNVLRIEQSLGIYRVHDNTFTHGATRSMRWILGHYMADNYMRQVAERAGVASVSLSGRYAIRAAMASVKNCMLSSGKLLAPRRAAMVFILWPSGATLMFMLMSLTSVLVPLPVIRALAGVTRRLRHRYHA